MTNSNSTANLTPDTIDDMLDSIWGALDSEGYDEHAQKAKAVQQYINALRVDLRVTNQLVSVTERLLEHYVGIVNSGDCGFWNPEEETVVIEARKALQPHVENDGG